MQPPRMRGADLVAWCELFGVNEGTTRVALSRMTERGELSANDGRYELSGALVERHGSQELAVYPDRPGPMARWTGEWSIVIVRRGGRDAARRAELRTALKRLRHVELREGVWARPANLTAAAQPVAAWHIVEAQCDRWRGEPLGVIDVADVFGLAAWAEHARALAQELAAATDRLGDEANIPRGFYVGAAVLQHLQRDPLLPRELLPQDWPAEELRTAYRAYHVRFARAAQRFFRARRDGSSEPVSLRPVTSTEVLG